MKKRQELYRTKEYWLETIQNEIFREVHAYMEYNNLNKADLARQLGFSRSYITQILNGEFNFSLKKLIELSLAINKAPKFEMEQLEDFIEYKEKHLTTLNSGMTISFNVGEVPFTPNENVLEVLLPEIA